MSNYKNTVLKDDPVAFWSFDGDMFDRATGELLVLPNTQTIILDEINQQSNAIMFTESDFLQSYKAGQSSLLDNDFDEQYSMIFGRGEDLTHPFAYSKTYLEIPHNAAFIFPDKGQFTLEFLYQRNADGFRSEQAKRYPTNYWYISYSRPIIIKGGVISVRFVSSYNTPEYISFVFPRSIELKVHLSNSRISMGKIHFAAVWEVKEIRSNVFVSTANVYANGVLVATESVTTYDSFTNTNVATSTYIGGYPVTNVDPYTLNDRNTHPLKLEKIAFYSKPLSANQVANHYKKYVNYRNMILFQTPSRFWEFDEEDNPNFYAIGAVGGLNLSIVGQHSKGQAGPSNIAGSKSFQFAERSTAALYDTSGYNQNLHNLSGDMGIEFWIAYEANSKCVVFQIQQEANPYYGIALIGNDTFAGSMHFEENGKKYQIPGTNWNNGEFFHFVFTKSGSNRFVYVNGSLVLTYSTGNYSLSALGRLNFFGSMPGNLFAGPGKLASVAMYTYHLQEMQVKERYSYSKTYRVRGTVTVRGTPSKAKVRMYSSRTGELLDETISDEFSGQYEFSNLTNEKVDLLVMGNEDVNVRYRTFGPIYPTEFDDLADII